MSHDLFSICISKQISFVPADVSCGDVNLYTERVSLESDESYSDEDFDYDGTQSFSDDEEEDGGGESLVFPSPGTSKRDYSPPEQRHMTNNQLQSDGLNYDMVGLMSSESPSNSRCGHGQLEEELIIRDPKEPAIYVRKVLHSTQSKDGKVKKRQRVQTNYTCCFICHKLVSNFRKHIWTHKTYGEVQELEKLKTIDEKEYFRKLTLLRLRGNHDHNMNVKTQRAGELIVARVYGTFQFQQYGACPSCLEWMKLLVAYGTHQAYCTAGSKRSLGQALIAKAPVVGDVSPVASTLLICEVYPVMASDEVPQLARTDRIIVALGNLWLRKTIRNKQKRKYYTSAKMGSCAWLLKRLQDITGEEQEVYSFIKPKYFNNACEAALQCARKDMDDESDFMHPSAALKFGLDLVGMATIKLAMALKDLENLDQDKEDSQNFMWLIKNEWGVQVPKLAHKYLRERQMLKSPTSLDPDSIGQLAEFLKKKVQGLSLKRQEAYCSYMEATKYSLARLSMYNKIRPGELQQTL